MTTGPGDEKAAGGSDRGHLRASHADREQVIAALRAAFIQGRLTRDEFGLRVGRALGARTYAELAALTADLPAALTGPPAHSAPQADIRPRGQRARRVAGILAAVAVLAATISVASLSRRTAAVAPPTPAGAVMYVGTPHGLIPVATGTNTPGKPIRLGARPVAIAFTPSGKTAYIIDNRRSVIPLATATNTPGKPIKIAGNPLAIAITPDGKTAYIVSYDNAKPSGSVIPVATATNTPGRPIRISGGQPTAITITPDGKTAYIIATDKIVPIDTATNTPVTPINIGHSMMTIAVTPDGKTAYVVSACGCAPVVTPVATATNTPGKPIKIGGSPWAIAITPDGKTAYVLDNFSAVLDPSGGFTQPPARIVPVATATNTPGKPIKIGHNTEVIAIAP
jgi:DNA-binding beta-propeller fold protein YncE